MDNPTNNGTMCNSSHFKEVTLSESYLRVGTAEDSVPSPLQFLISMPTSIRFYQIYKSIHN